MRIDQDAMALPFGLSWQTASDIGHWVWTHKLAIAWWWVWLSLVVATLWVIIMAIGGNMRDDDE